MCDTLKGKRHNIYMSSHRRQPMSWDTHLLLGQSEWHAANKISERQVSEAVEVAARDSYLRMMTSHDAPQPLNQTFETV